MNQNIWEMIMVIIKKLGYGGIFAATGLEYACFPLSSEILLPFIGFTVSKGDMNLGYTIFFSTLGGVCGCSFCYFIGRFGEKFIHKTLCRKLKSVDTGIRYAKRYFDKYGKQSVLIARVFPLARTYISIPAGMAHMEFKSFFIYSALGALIWNTALISLGYYLGDHWENTAAVISQHKGILFGILFVLILFLCRKIYLKLKRKNRNI